MRELVKLTLDGQEVRVQPGVTIYWAAKAAGMRTLMYDGKIKIFNGVTTPAEVVRITQTEGEAVD